MKVPILSPKHVLFIICFLLILFVLKHQTMYEVLEGSTKLKDFDQYKRTLINLWGGFVSAFERW